MIETDEKLEALHDQLDIHEYEHVIEQKSDGSSEYREQCSCGKIKLKMSIPSVMTDVKITHHDDGIRLQYTCTSEKL